MGTCRKSSLDSEESEGSSVKSFPFPATARRQGASDNAQQVLRGACTCAFARSLIHKYLRANHLLGARVRKRSKTQLLPPRCSQSLGGDLGRASITTQSEEFWDGDVAGEDRGLPAAHGRPCSGGRLQGPVLALWGPGSSNGNPGCHRGRARRARLTHTAPAPAISHVD